jgi:hypothetical protein
MRAGGGCEVTGANGRQNAPKGGGACVAEDRTGATRKDSCHPLALFAEPAMAYGVNTAMNAVQELSLHPSAAALTANSDPFQLGEGDHTVLVRGQARDRRLRTAIGTFCMHGYA